MNKLFLSLFFLGVYSLEIGAVSAYNLEQLARQADKRAKAPAMATLELLQQDMELVATIYGQTSEVLGDKYLIVQQVRSLENQWKQEVKKMRKKKKKAAIADSGISTKVLSKAAEAAREAAKWTAKAEAQLAT